MKIVVNVEILVRIDKYLASITDYSRESITGMWDNGYMLVNGNNVKARYKPSLKDIIQINNEFVQVTNVSATKMPLNIVYEDKYLMVINKPSGLVVHPGNGNFDNTLVNGLMYYTKNLSDIGDAKRPGIVHRLDKDTSGLMLIAKENKTHELLAEEFKKHNIHREYIALVDGLITVSKGTIDAPIKRSKDNYQVMSVAPGGKNAITHFTVIKRYKHNTLIRLLLETGRTHQIRVHMAYIGYPIHNDPVYNSKQSTPFGQFLHSEYLKFIHPITKKELEFRCSIPDEFQDYLNTLEEQN